MLNLTDVLTAAEHAGGITIHLDGTIPANGYAVSLDGTEMRTRVIPSPGLLAAWAREHLIDWGNAACLGLWRDPETGYWHADVSRIILDRQQALILAAEQNQKAVFDLAKGESITIPVEVYA